MIHPRIAYPPTYKNIVISSTGAMKRQKNMQPSSRLSCVFVPLRFVVIEESRIPGRVGAGVVWSRVGTLASTCGEYVSREEFAHGYSCRPRQHYNRSCRASATLTNPWRGCHW